MSSIEDLADMVGRDHPIVRKELLRLENGMTSVQEATVLFGRLLKKKRGITMDDLGPFIPPDHSLLTASTLHFAEDWETQKMPIGLLPTFINISISGSPGGGKTEIMRRLGYEYITNENAKVKIFDFLGNFSGLSQCCHNCVSLDTPSVNILVNDGVPLQKWINVLFDLIAFHTDTMIGGRSFLNRVNEDLIGIFRGTGERPCLKDISDYMGWLLNKRKLNMSDRGYCERIMGKLISWESESGGAFSYQCGVL